MCLRLILHFITFSEMVSGKFAVCDPYYRSDGWCRNAYGGANPEADQVPGDQWTRSKHREGSGAKRCPRSISLTG